MDGKVMVVTGGASGIGRATVLRFSEEGYRPVILDRDAEAGAATLALLEATPAEGQFIQADSDAKGRGHGSVRDKSWPPAAASTCW